MIHPSTERFIELLDEMKSLSAKKGSDYGRAEDPFANVAASNEWGVPAWVGAMIRLNDKVRRLQTFAHRGTLSNESAYDSFIDVSVYALIALILWEREQEDQA